MGILSSNYGTSFMLLHASVQELHDCVKGKVYNIVFLTCKCKIHVCFEAYKVKCMVPLHSHLGVIFRFARFLKRPVVWYKFPDTV